MTVNSIILKEVPSQIFAITPFLRLLSMNLKNLTNQSYIVINGEIKIKKLPKNQQLIFLYVSG